MSIFNFANSRTVQGALYLLPVLATAVKLDQLDDAIYAKLPKNMKERGTLEEYKETFKTGKAFVHSLWELFHK